MVKYGMKKGVLTNHVLIIRGPYVQFLRKCENLKAKMQGCKRLEPKHVMKNDPHARVVRSVIKTAGRK